MPTSYERMCVAYGVSKRQKTKLQEENEKLREENFRLSKEVEIWKEKYFKELEGK